MANILRQGVPSEWHTSIKNRELWKICLCVQTHARGIAKEEQMRIKLIKSYRLQIGDYSNILNIVGTIKKNVLEIFTPHICK